MDGKLNLVNPRTGLQELVPPPPVDDPQAQSYIIQSSLVESILAVKVVGGVKKIYINFQGTKVWMDLQELSKFKWSLTGQPVTIADDFLLNIAHQPSDFVYNGVRFYRNILPGGPINFDASPFQVSLINI